MKFFFSIKGKDSDSECDVWMWPPLWSDIIDAKSRSAARQKIEEEYGRKFPMRVLRKDIESADFILNIRCLSKDTPLMNRLIDILICPVCEKKYTLLEKYQLGGTGGGMSYCSIKCFQDSNRSIVFDEELRERHKPTIYLIKNIKTDMVYVGKTVLPMTMRWWQHFRSRIDEKMNSKFHQAIRGSDLVDWTFQVIEEIDIPENIKDNTNAIEKLILSRERWHIESLNSKEKGYNTL